MVKNLLIALRTTLVTLAVTGVAYPLLLTGLAQGLFPERAQGSLVRDERGVVVGSSLIGQPFTSPAYFQPRPSAAGDKGWDAQTSGGSNLGPTSKKLRERVEGDLKAFAASMAPATPGVPIRVPGELVSASASGLDPHLSPAAARWQLPRVAAARRVAASRVAAVLEANVEGRDLGILGEPRVNVLVLNLALDRLFGRAPTSPGEAGRPAAPASPPAAPAPAAP